MRKLSPLALAIAALLSTPAQAQTPAVALATRWRTICATAINNTVLFQRCGETNASLDPQADFIAATGQRLNQIPGQGRIATRDFSGMESVNASDLAGNPVSLVYGQRADGSLGLNATDNLAAQWSLFFSADVGRLKRDEGLNEAGFDADTHSFTAGANWQPSAKWLLGLALNHTVESLAFNGDSGSADTRYTGLIATISHPYADTWSLDGYAGFLRGRYDLVRDIDYSLMLPSGPLAISGRALANPDATRSVQGVSTTGTWSKNGWDRILDFGVDASRTSIDPYSESGGAGLALSVPGRSVQTRRARVDFTLDKTISREWGIWQPSLRVGWRQEFSNARRAVTVRLIEDPRQNPITFDTEDPDKGWGEIALGSVFTFTHGKSGFIEFRQRFAHAYLHEQVLSLGFRIEL
ncbi:MAG TPA: autotransporter outer membrane beta-barrel domain-containing protein [Arenimonas sp.]|uniref:autotransporter outer membrane beta-barrel domain-containing protein n=1 Tax=Arenimonas sp. TaxID=1872635 RepID=UPI002BEB5850|nr:autotransporter outer membrane beta-barrel domain-containing protein [Arenimonas sp.]HMB56798.1 autotransporter outer membrane beta-barrel domain-containing protein [Arenimonas sp.]